MEKRLSCQITKSFHDKLKKIAKRKNITLTKYVIRALMRYSMREDYYERLTEHDK